MEKDTIRNKLLEIKKNITFKKDVQRDIEYYKKKSLEEHKYYSMLYCDIKDKDDYELYKGWDEKGSIPLDLGLKLRELMNDQSVYLYIHRTAIINNKDIYDDIFGITDVMQNGLINNGNALTNGSQKELVPAISKAADLVSHDIPMQIYLKTHRYDSFGNLSTGAVILVIPREYINKEGEIIVDPNLVYNYNHGFAYIKPEFILGATTLNHGVCKFYSKEELLSNKKEI